MDLPKLLAKAWALTGLKNDIPDDRSSPLSDERATYSDGFPQITMTPIAQGGKAPSGKDMNGVLNEITSHIVFQNKGGNYLFNQEFAEKIGGYSKGAVLINDNYTAFFISLVDNNLTNFNTVGYAGYWEIIATTDINDWVKPKTITSSTNNTVDNTGHTHNIDQASTSKSGIVQLTNALDSDSETLGLTAKAGKTLKTLINALTSNLTNYIPNSKKSNSVTSTSSDTVATSYAVKTAYDKAVAANDNANTRVSKSGGEMTGGLKLKTIYGASEKKWDYSGFYAGSATLNNENLPYFQIHISSYGGNTAGYAKSLGFNLTDYKAYVMSWNSEGEYAGKKEILTELHRSDSVTSASSVTVATSKAVKTAYDKGVEALNVANSAANTANTKLDKNANAVSASKLQTARKISLTGAVSGSGNFDGSGNLSIATTDNLTIGLVTSTSSTGISNAATSNGNTYLNVVETRGGAANAISSSTRVTGTGLVDVYSDSSGVLTIRGNRDSGKLNTSGNQSLAGKLTVDDILLASNGNRSLSQVINAFNCLFTGNRDGLKNIVNSWGQSGTTPLGVSYDFSNANAWWINFGPLYGGLIIQGGNVTSFSLSNNAEISIKYPINFSKNSLTPILSSTAGVVSGGSADSDNGAFIRYTDKTIFIINSPWMNMTSIYYGPLRWIAFGI